MSFKRAFVFFGLSTVLPAGAGLASACGSDCADTGSCNPFRASTGGAGGARTEGGTGASGAGGASGGSDSSTGCNQGSTPDQESCLLSDQYAVFVAPGGAGAGTMASPAATIQAGIDAARAQQKSVVIVCNATYAEAVLLSPSSAGIGIFGGYRCPGDAQPWTYDGNNRPSVEPPIEAPALTVEMVSAPVVVQDLKFVSKDATAPGGSSIAMIVHQSTSVLFTRVAAQAGKGADGKNGTLTAVAYPAASALKGKDAVGEAGGLSCSYTCPDGNTTTGGGGGRGASSPTDGAAGLPDLGGGAPGTVAQCKTSGVGGGFGAPALALTPAPGATVAGGIVNGLWVPAAGTKGSAGGVGQGGGGGGGALGTTITVDGGNVSTGGGGGGGCGGCGGAGGGAGSGGGASIALLVTSSVVTLDGADLTTMAGGKGGAGVAGQPGQDGGIHGLPTGAACLGGNGGKGADGAAGGGGAGGSSVAVVYAGQKPTIVQMKTTLGAAGAAGPGGVPGTNDGIAGVSQTDLGV